MLTGMNINWIDRYMMMGCHGDVLVAGTPWESLDPAAPGICPPGSPPPVGYASNAATANYARPGTYILKANGKGSIQVIFQGTGSPTFDLPAPPPEKVLNVPSGIATFTGSESYGFTIPNTQHLGFRILSSDPSDPLTNIRCAAPGASLFGDAIRLYHPEFLAALSGFKCLRFMDPQWTSGSSEVNWSDRQTRRGLDLESMIDLANELGIDPWFCIPARTTFARTSPSDWCRRFGDLLNSRLNPALTVRLEFSNEVWNVGRPWIDEFVWTWSQGNLEDDLTTASAWSEYARLAHSAMQVIEQRINPSGPKVKRVYAGQMGNSATIGSTMRVARSRGYRVDEISGALYWGFQGDLDAVRKAWSSGDQSGAIRLISEGARAGFATTASYIPDYIAAVAESGPVPPLVTYEGGFSADQLTNPDLAPAFNAYLYNNSCKQDCLDAFAAFEKAGVSLFNWYSYIHPNPVTSSRLNPEDRKRRPYWALRHYITGGDPVWFDDIDSKTQGSWSGTYGSIASILPSANPSGGYGPAPKISALSGVSINCNITYTWAAVSTDPRATTPSVPGPASKSSAVCWNDPNEIDIDIPGPDQQQLTLYFLDWQQFRGPLSVQIIDGATGAVIDTQTVSNYGGGVYYKWTIPGHVKVKITKAGSPDVVLSGIFLDPVP